MFNINYDRLIQLLLPVHLRAERMLLFLKAMLRPLKTLYNGFLSYRQSTLRTLSHTGQVNSLEQLLNDLYSPTARGIEITDSTDNRWPPAIYNHNEGQPALYLYNKSETAPPNYLFNTIEYNLMTDFIVRIPMTTTATSDQIRSTVNRYRQAGKRYSLQYYDQTQG